MWRLFPQFRGFRASFGDFCSCLRNFSASASIPWLRLWCGSFAPSAYPPLISILQLLALWVLAAGPHLWWSLCVCGVLSEAAELCLLSLLLLGVG